MAVGSEQWIRFLKSGLFVYDVFRPWVHRLEGMAWRRQAKATPPPPPVKYRAVREYGARFALDTLVETGTFLGDMIQNTRRDFARIYSIELDPRLCARAQRRFRRFPHITILQGDSAQVLPTVLARLDRPALFWLDAHYSGGITTRGPLDSPIVFELEAILSHPVREHAILIDDAHDFSGAGGYPDIQTLRAFLLEKRPGWLFAIQDDIIRFHPPELWRATGR